MRGGDAASMFAGEPQPVEIHHRGIWYSGELIGWRHESNGRVAARVRCRVDGLRHSAWMDLADLRLPDPRRPPHKEPFPAVVRRPVPLGAWDQADETRPHVMLAGMRSRPPKPAHAVQPPAAGDGPSRPAVERESAHSEAAHRVRHQHLTQVDAHLTVA